MSMQESDTLVARRAPQMHRVAVGVIVAVAALMVIADVIQAIALGTGRVLVRTGGTNPRASLDGLARLITSGSGGGAAEAVRGAGLVDRFLVLVPSLLHVAVVVLATILLLRIMHGVSAGEPFSASIRRCWQQLAVVLLCGGAAQMVVDLVVSFRLTEIINHYFGVDRTPLAERILTTGIDFTPVSTNVPTIVAGLVALALTAAFRTGARLVEDADGLV